MAWITRETPVQLERENTQPEQSREWSRDLAFEESIMVSGGHEEVLEILGNTDNNGH
jgi:hypothetical protein